MSNEIRSLAVYDDGSGAALYAGGRLVTAGGVTVNHIAKWDGTAWSALSGPSGTGTNFLSRSFAVYDDGSGAALYVGGSFDTAGGVTVNNIAKWDGTEWSALSGPAGTGMDGNILAFAVYDDGSGAALYAGGLFTTAGGVTVNNIAKWDGTEWSSIGGPVGSAIVFSLAVYDDGSGAALYAGGFFPGAGRYVSANNIAKWDGSEWSALSGPAGNGTSYMINALAVYDDCSGAALYAGGNFGSAGGLSADNIARWDGTEWSVVSGPAGTGTNSEVKALAVHDDGSGAGLYAGGTFGSAGGIASGHIGKWSCPAPMFADGFESGHTFAWSATVGGP
ncbi:MAG: hypothetical protein GY856_41410 [bacterium]|nr:hypothetical protein [bacterium]